MKNSITLNNGIYTLTLLDGSTYTLKTWIENKKDGRSYEHVIIPKEAREICGRTYVRTSLINPTYEFDNKTEHREGLGNGGWKSRLTEDELRIYENCEKTMNELKELAMSREPKVLTEAEKIQREIDRLTKRLSNLNN